MSGIDDFLDEITLAIGVLLIAFGLAAFRRTRKFIADCLTTEGRISGYTTEDSEDGVYYFSIIRFRAKLGSDLRSSRKIQNRGRTFDLLVL